MLIFENPVATLTLVRFIVSWFRSRKLTAGLQLSSVIRQLHIATRDYLVSKVPVRYRKGPPLLRSAMSVMSVTLSQRYIIAKSKLGEGCMVSVADNKAKAPTPPKGPGFPSRWEQLISEKIRESEGQ